MPLRIFTNTQMMMHDTGRHHPETAARLSVIEAMIAREFPDLTIEQSFPAREEDLLPAHPQSHLDFILDQTPFDGLHALDGGDTILSANSYDAALLSAGTAIQAVKAVCEGDAQYSFALARPPGHHAEYDRAMGFCLFNNAFIAALASGKKTLIFDFDVHHGNGTEDLVKRRVADGHTDIAYASIHEGGIFPGTGDQDYQNICNAPLPSRATSDQFRAAFTDRILPFMTGFEAELIICSAGFDGHKEDAISTMQLDHDDYGWIADRLRQAFPATPIASILEGGYNLQALPLSVKAYVEKFTGNGDTSI